MSRVWIAFGSNQQEPLEQLLQARRTLAEQAELSEEAASAIYQTPPWGFTEQADFYNAVIRYHTDSAPHAVLGLLQRVERLQHRRRTVKNGPRTLDLDMLLYDDAKIETEYLTIPHPRMRERAFVLQPLADIDPQLHLPGGGTVADLLASCNTDAQRSIEIRQWSIS